MAKNGAKGSGQVGVVARQSEIKGPKTGNWTWRDPAEGRFVAMKKKGGPFKGVRREV